MVHCVDKLPDVDDGQERLVVLKSWKLDGQDGSWGCYILVQS